MEQLFRNYIENRCTIEEIQEVLTQLNTPEGRELMERVLSESSSDTPLSVPTHAQMTHGWARLSTYVSSNTENPTLVARVLPLWSKRALRVAAVVLPLLVSMYWVWWGYFKATEPITITTEYAQVKRIMLPDGSVVTLNGNSSLSYQADWSAFATREVWLRGEGFFEVTHQQNHQKFLVHTRHSHTVEVLGTEFNVSARSQNTHVALKSGKIKLTVQQKDEARSLIMKPGQEVAIDSSSRRVQMNTVKTENVAVWREKKLVFNGTQLSEIAQMLKETYDIEVNVKDQRVMQERITGTIPSGNIQELLTALSSVLHLRYTQENNQVKFY